MAVTLGIVIFKLGKPVRYYFLHHYSHDPVSWAQLKDWIIATCYASEMHPRIGHHDIFHVIMKKHREGKANKMDTVGYFQCEFSLATASIQVKKFQIAPVGTLRGIKEEFFMNEKGIKYPVPRLMEIDPTTWDPLKSALHHDQFMSFRSPWSMPWSTQFGHKVGQFASFEDMYAGEFHANPHHAKFIGGKAINKIRGSMDDKMK